ncbi:hypothetical protein V5O48_014454 [Marasmius crinis-equi]|uniref:Fungal lipase-type domain-containing protein n=1 Tax=Marasmius crinis-equi TaxID=585013 RepID=A0ABR3EX89_9AGAR
MVSINILVALFLLPLTLSAPLFGLFEDDDNETPPTPLSVTDLETDFLRAAQFSRVAYCSNAAVTAWECGGPCDEIGKGVKVIQAGGDDGLIPMCEWRLLPSRYTRLDYSRLEIDFVAHDPTTNSIVVAHQGTNSKNLLSILNDAQFLLKDINTDRFTSAKDKDIEVHDGFQKTFERTADGVLDGVKRGLADFNSTKVQVTGHSLGASVAILDALMLKQELDSSVEIQTTLFGTPRVGNQEFADFVDATLGSTLTRITNQNDPVPLVPPHTFGYQHPSGEVHIKAVDASGQATDVVSCAGQENESDGCSSGNGVLGLLKLDVPAHKGPYFNNISFSGKACPL